MYFLKVIFKLNIFWRFVSVCAGYSASYCGETTPTRNEECFEQGRDLIFDLI